VNAAAAFLFSPSLLVLDEPTNGLDPAAAGIVRAKIRSCREAGRTVLLTSHIMSEIEELADDVILLYDGTVRFSGDVATLKQKTHKPSVEDAVAVLMRSTLAA
jgi:Cu-processing system ATP-binding protein